VPRESKKYVKPAFGVLQTCFAIVQSYLVDILDVRRDELFHKMITESTLSTGWWSFVRSPRPSCRIYSPCASRVLWFPCNASKFSNKQVHHQLQDDLVENLWCSKETPPEILIKFYFSNYRLFELLYELFVYMFELSWRVHVFKIMQHFCILGRNMVVPCQAKRLLWRQS
jgi:hypothetical protein